MEPAESLNEALKREWTDQYVEVNPEQPELKRFAGIVGRVVTVNCNNKAVIDFQDGGWYDITASRGVPAQARPRRGQGQVQRQGQQRPADPDETGIANRSLRVA